MNPNALSPNPLEAALPQEAMLQNQRRQEAGMQIAKMAGNLMSDAVSMTPVQLVESGVTITSGNVVGDVTVETPRHADGSRQHLDVRQDPLNGFKEEFTLNQGKGSSDKRTQITATADGRLSAGQYGNVDKTSMDLTETRHAAAVQLNKVRAATSPARAARGNARMAAEAAVQN